MSEYWKSTPKYWCKFCSVFVKDTKLERQQHDATPRHQNNIQKSLRNLHRDKEREDREKARAKAEVARLNGVVGANGSGSGAGSGPATSTASTNAPAKKATLEERKRQMQQLADMGVAVPEEFRREMGMAGDWQTVAVRRIEHEPDIKDDPDSKDVKAFGVRKRKFEDQEEEEAILGTGEASMGQKKNRAWGARMKTFPDGSGKGGEGDLDALLGGVTVKRKAQEDDQGADVESEAPVQQDDNAAKGVLELKKSDSQEEEDDAAKLAATAPDIAVKAEQDPGEAPSTVLGAGIVFKKRKKIVR